MDDLEQKVKKIIAEQLGKMSKTSKMRLRLSKISEPTVSIPLSS